MTGGQCVNCGDEMLISDHNVDGEWREHWPINDIKYRGERDRSFAISINLSRNAIHQFIHSCLLICIEVNLVLTLFVFEVVLTINAEIFFTNYDHFLKSVHFVFFFFLLLFFYSCDVVVSLYFSFIDNHLFSLLLCKGYIRTAACLSL